MWPPARVEPVADPTQPIQALPSAGPLPPSTPPPPPPGPPTAETAAQPPRRSRTLLLSVGAVAALVLGIGAPTVDRYIFFKSGRQTETRHEVQPGQSLTFEHVTWKSVIEPMETPQGSQHNTPDRQWLKITVTRTAADDTGAVLTAKPALTVQDPQQRTWQVEVVEDDIPPEKNEVGKAYTYTAAAVVPKAVANEVQLHLKPDITYRNDTPTDKLMQVNLEDSAKKRNDVLIFRR
ncbi:hypothetical protein ABT294_47845 [Nonomuraea sp. NPDC000554]|uniref:hypothetical protein n=1 Tax=Nonomuraea sp. NPDC000554 TaxID=3154259 RepID=UPI0033195DEF